MPRVAKERAARACPLADFGRRFPEVWPHSGAVFPHLVGQPPRTPHMCRRRRDARPAGAACASLQLS